MQEFMSPEATFVYAQWIFLKLLALSFFCAFYSLFIQVKGLYGEYGIIPMKDIFEGTKRGSRWQHFYYTPSIFWYSASDQMLRGVALAGIIGSCLMFIGIAVPWILLLLCFLYLSYVSSGIYFLSFQWDTLLIETGFVGIIFSIQTPPLAITVFLMWVLLFRFMFSSGIVKFLIGSPDWRDLTAMYYHYETQPLPTRLAYYMHQLPRKFTRFTTAFVFVVELIVPFFIFINPEFRLVAFFIFIFFQILLMLTGNFAFFNLITLALCFTLLEDRYFTWMKNLWDIPSYEPTISMSIFVSMSAVIMIVLNFFQFVALFKRLPMVDRVLNFISPFFIVNSYGLFSYMTQNRYEIIIEGSNDGETWHAYEFKWKPGDLNEAPRQVAPHQPRLDWQMWFASLGHARQNPWFTRLIIRLLQGSPEVLDLFKKSPFPPENPPKHIRALLYQYHFTTLEEKHETNNWWNRTYLGVYYPPASL